MNNTTELLKARSFYHKYGYVLSLMVLDDILYAIHPENKIQEKYYKNIKKLIEEKKIS